MSVHEVNCSIDVVDVDSAWAHIRDFGSDWHPDIVNNTLSVDPSGAFVREFTGSDGSVYREQRTYQSDTDKLLRYAMTAGIDGVESYRGEASIFKKVVRWSAMFDADGELGPRVAQGSRKIFDNGLEWLQKNAGVKEKKNDQLTSKNQQLQSCTIKGEVKLSVLHTVAIDQPCWTLVLFLHGIGGNASNWTDQLKACGSGYAAAALDIRGYGESELGDSQSRIDDYCADIIRVMKHFGARKLVLVGLSMGSWIATSFAMRHPQLLAGLVLAGGCTGMSEADTVEREAFLTSRAEPLASGKTPADFAPTIVDFIAGPSATQEQRDQLHQSMASISSDTYLDALTCFTQPVEKFDFSRIGCPLLLMTGEYDRLATPDEIRLVSLRVFDEINGVGKLPDICFEVIADAGHLCNLEKPDLFNQHLMRFVERIPGAAMTKSLSRESKRQAKNQAILDAALKEFSARGYDGASMSKIAAQAQVSKPTLYQYFSDKEGLFAAVLQQGCEHIITPLSAPDGSLVDRLWNFSWVYADFVLREDMLSLARLVLGEASRRPEVAESYHQMGPGKAFQGLIQFIEECIATGELEVDDVEHAAQDLWSLILSGPRDHYLHFVNQRPERQQLLRTISHGLRVFVTVYSTNVAVDLAALERKFDSHKLTARSDRG